MHCFSLYKRWFLQGIEPMNQDRYYRKTVATVLLRLLLSSKNPLEKLRG